MSTMTTRKSPGLPKERISKRKKRKKISSVAEHRVVVAVGRKDRRMQIARL
jgi:hypothetical protein